MENVVKKINGFLENYGLVIILIIGFFAGLLTTIWSYNNHFITAYADSQAHLVIARRVFDNLTPGIAQLGGVWLPLYHVLILPLVTNHFLYLTGLAGSIVNFVFYLLSIYFIYELVSLFTDNKIVGFIGALIYTLNVDVLYMQTASMTEILALFFITSSIFYFVRWQKKQTLTNLLILSFFVFLGTLTRYENWVIAISIVLGIILTFYSNRSFSWINFKKLESNLILFSYCAFFGIGLWFLWNLLIFHNPLYFLHSVWSAEAFQFDSIKNGLNKPYHNVYYAFIYYLHSVADVSSWLLVAMGFIGAITILIRKRSLEVLALIGVSFSVFVFESYSIFKGNTTIFLPELFPFDYYNIRYGLYSLPFFIMFTSSLFIIKNKFISFLTILVIIYAVGFPLYKFKPITLTDAIVSRNGNAGYEKVVPEYVTFFHKNYSGGLILLSSGVASDILLEADINLKNYITEGNGKYWDGSLVNPEKYASWVILNKDTSNIRNLLGIKLINSPKLAKYYNLIYSDNQILIYKRL